MIYYMSTKTLVTKFTKEHSPKEILDCRFYSFSNRLIPSKQMTSIPYSQKLFFGLCGVADSPEKSALTKSNIDLVVKHIMDDSESGLVLSDLVKNSLVDKDKIFIILSSKRETKTQFPFYLAKAIEEAFRYPVVNYNSKERFEDHYYDPKDVLKRVNYIQARALLNSFSYDDFKKKKKREMKELLSDAGYDVKGMDSEEMLDLFEDEYGLPFR